MSEEHASETVTTRLGRPRDEIARLADRHTMAVQTWLSTRAPCAARLDGLGVTAGSSGLAVPLLNLLKLEMRIAMGK